MNRIALLVLCASIITPTTPAHAQHLSDSGGFVDGGGYEADHKAHQPCVPPAERARLEAFMRQLDENNFTNTDQSYTNNRGGQPVFEFYPIGGSIYGDLFLNNYTDLDTATSGVLDWDCGDHTYNTHRGHDTGLRSFEEQFIGVPIFAALKGTVVDRDDGHFDQNTSWQGQPANYVIIDHSAIEPGLRTIYLHMKNGSVLPQIGEHVDAGQQIGQVASSGNSTGPHLHFEVWRNGGWVETMAGPCSPYASMWADQWSKPTEHYVRDFGFLRELFPGDFDTPHPFPRDRSVTLDTDHISYWMQGANLPAFSMYRFRFFMPNGVLDYDSGNRLLNFSDSFYRRYWARYQWDITDMQNVPGVWTVAIDMNDERVINAKVTVLDTGETYINTPPTPAFAIFEPAEPTEDDAVFIRLQSDLVHDDFEYDLVRYRYAWSIDGAVVRDTISAGHADAIPSVASLGGGTQLCVSITPNDGDLDVFTTNHCVTIKAHLCPADINGDGNLSPTDFTAWIGAFNANAPQCDQNNDGMCTPTDFSAWISNYNAGCD